jgi:hypothetical protein
MFDVPRRVFSLDNIVVCVAVLVSDRLSCLGIDGFGKLMEAVDRATRVGHIYLGVMG